jgi:hypothetical protein
MRNNGGNVMRNLAITIALLVSGSAIAQTTTDADLDANADTTVETDSLSDADTTVHTGMTSDTTVTGETDTISSPVPVTVTPASAPVVQPSNADPERDARGIAVISAAAVVPAGFNGIAGTAVGGPLVDPTTGETVDTSADSYPACTATVTDNCLQTYERGRSSS